MLFDWILYFCFILAVSVGVPFIGQETAAVLDGRRAADERTIQFWVGSESDYQSEGVMVGCGDFLLPVDTGIRRSGDTSKDLRLALAALFSPNQKHPAAAYQDWVKQLGLTVESITIDNGSAAVRLTGGRGLWGIAASADAVMEAQILQTVFQFETIERAMVTDGAVNLREITDMSDRHSQEARRHYVYVRPED